MAEKAHLWLADMYLENDMHEESEKLRSLKYCQQDLFEVIDADSEYAVVKNSNDEEFKTLILTSSLKALIFVQHL